MKLEEIRTKLKEKLNLKIGEEHHNLDFYVYSHKNLLIAVAGHETTMLPGIYVEHKNNFDKWRRAFYQSNLPHNEEQIGILLKDIEYVRAQFNQKEGLNFGGLKRHFALV